MKKKLRINLFVSLCLAAISAASAQIPNAGFESWAGSEPVNWITDNVPQVYTPITQSNDAHSGTSSLQGTVATYFTYSYPPVAWASFTIGAHYGSLTGWYKFSPVGGDSLDVVVVFYKGGNGLASGIFSTGASASSYTQFTAPITYITSGVPDSAWIEILIASPSGTAQPGSTFKIDDLSFGTATTGIRESNSSSPAVFALSQNYPNPFNPSTKISYQLPTEGLVHLEVYDIMGRTLTTLVNEEKPAGQFTATFDASQLPSGIYFYRLHVTARNGRSFSQTNKMILMK
jgi:hypothetical protein